MSNKYVNQSEDVPNLGELLMHCRESKELSIEDVARKTAMSPEQVKAIERGDSDFFKKPGQSMDWYAKIYAKKMGVHLGDRKESVNTTKILPSTSQNQYLFPIPTFLKKNNKVEIDL